MPRFRFAPSPNGLLHEGHAYSARLNRGMADRLGGRFLIRMEDIDTVRCPPLFAQRALDDLASIGIVSDEPVLHQSTRTAAYREALNALIGAGFAYPARMSRREIAEFVANAEAQGTAWPRDPDGAPHYPLSERDAWRGRDRSFDNETGAAWRLDVQHALERTGSPPDWIEVDATGDRPVRVRGAPDDWGDPVLWRRDGVPAYHLAVAVDDAHQAITHVVRGTDLRPATSIHRVLQQLLELPEPLYHHHELVRDPTRRKLSKRAGDGARRPLADSTGTGKAP